MRASLLVRVGEKFDGGYGQRKVECGGVAAGRLAAVAVVMQHGGAAARGVPTAQASQAAGADTTTSRPKFESREFERYS